MKRSRGLLLRHEYLLTDCPRLPPYAGWGSEVPYVALHHLQLAMAPDRHQIRYHTTCQIAYFINSSLARCLEYHLIASLLWSPRSKSTFHLSQFFQPGEANEENGTCG
jgi:hypothetical protein